MKKHSVKKTNDTVFYIIITLASVSSVFILFGIILSIFSQGLKLFNSYNFLDFITGLNWYPVYDPPDFGILPIIAGSLLITSLTIIIAVPFSIATAVYISEIAKPHEKEILKPVIEVLASIPSVIYGLFGMAVFAPFIQKLLNLKTGFNAFTASIILGIMIIPIISSISEDAINAVPMNLREASYALGATKWETIFKVVLPAAKSGIITSVILGIGRAIGETMVVLMVAGNSAVIPKTIFDSVRPMTSTLASEMGETPVGSTHYYALFAIAAVLFVITLILNFIIGLIRGSLKTRHNN
ncbi:MAG: phosphate ABC transporter permease subunit PstC [Spirochaetes bacterium]|nr:phosphate ABC transporter permease subunit PstC [Spirochaetota bacterium]